MTLGGVAAKNILRNKSRTILTILGIAVAIITFIFLRTVIASSQFATDHGTRERLITQNAVSMVMPLPLRYVDKIEELPNVESVVNFNWFQGTIPGQEDVYFSSFAIDPGYFDIAPELAITKEHLEAWRADRQGVIVGEVLAKKTGWEVGKKITLESPIYPAPPGSEWTFTVRGFYKATNKADDSNSLLMHFDYLNDGLPPNRQDQVAWLVTKISKGANPADVSASIDKLFEDSDSPTLTKDEAAYQQEIMGGFSAVFNAIDLISVIILVIMMLVLGNTIAMGVRERTQEYGVLRAIGFLPRHVIVFIVGEAIVTAVLGGLLGVLLGFPLVEYVIGKTIEENFFPYFKVPPATLAIAVGLSVLLGALAGIFPALGASKIKVSDALRRVA